MTIFLSDSKVYTYLYIYMRRNR